MPRNNISTVLCWRIDMLLQYYNNRDHRRWYNSFLTRYEHFPVHRFTRVVKYEWIFKLRVISVNTVWLRMESICLSLSEYSSMFRYLSEFLGGYFLRKPIIIDAISIIKRFKYKQLSQFVKHVHYLQLLVMPCAQYELYTFTFGC